MIRIRRRNVLILALIVFALIGLFFFFYVKSAQADYRDEATIELNGTTTKTLKVNFAAFKPGEHYEYAVNLKCKAEGDYNVELEFEQTLDGGLKDYLSVEIACGDETYRNTLSAMLDGGEKTRFGCSLSAEAVTKILFRFYMPVDVGNEAQGKVADFNVILTASIAT